MGTQLGVRWGRARVGELVSGAAFLQLLLEVSGKLAAVVREAVFRRLREDLAPEFCTGRRTRRRMATFGLLADEDSEAATKIDIRGVLSLNPQNFSTKRH